MSKRYHSNGHQIVRYEFSGTIHWQLLYGYFEHLDSMKPLADFHIEKSAFEQREERGLSAELVVWCTTSQREALDRFVETTLDKYILLLRNQKAIGSNDTPIKLRSKRKVTSVD